jgi:hypothetical protein
MLVSVKRISVAERRARLGVRHHFGVHATTVTDAARGVVCLHAIRFPPLWYGGW